MLVDLELEVYNASGGGLTTVAKRVDLPWLPRREDAFLVEGGIHCSVEQTTFSIDGRVSLRLRVRQAGDAQLILAQLLRVGWANPGEAQAQPMR